MIERVNVIWLDESDKDKTNVIYMLIFPNWKYYIGQTRRKLEVRVDNHSWISEHPKTKKERAVKKYKTFHVMVLDVCKDLDELNDKEQYWIELYNSIIGGYNSIKGGRTYEVLDETRKKLSESNKGKIVSDETRKKMSEAAKGRIISDEHRKKMSEAAKGKIISDEHRRKLSESNKGKIVSDEHRRKLSESNKGKIVSDETRKKISESKKGKTRTDEHRKRISEANKGKIRSDETRKKISESGKGLERNTTKCKSIPDNIVFDSIKQCQEYYTELYGNLNIKYYLDNCKIHIKSGQTFVRIKD